MTLLPRFFVLKYDGKYLTVAANDSKSSLPPGFLKFNEKDIWSPRVKFAVEPAETGDGTFVHIRSCYNNKYLVKEHIENDNWWIVASAEKPEEDRTKASCTLFEPHYSAEKTTVRLRHVQSQINATHHNMAGSATEHGMLINFHDSGTAFEAIDSKRLILLPTLVTFQTDDKAAKYVYSRRLKTFSWQKGWPYQRFEDDHDGQDPEVAKQLFPTADGYYRIKDLYFDKFWRRSKPYWVGADDNWIWGDGEADNYSNETLFSVVKLGDNVIALKNLENNRFCGPLTAEGESNCLNAHYPTLRKETRLVIEEVVLQRTISELKYRLSDSRIYGEENIECDTAIATNDSLDERSTFTLSFSITNTNTTSWSNALSLKCGPKVVFETERIPFIGSGRVELSAEVGNTYVWGETKVDTSTRGSSYSVSVPQSTTMKVTMMCTKAACDVPFAYTQTELLPSGDWVSTIKDDGIFTGINSYNFRFESEVVPN